LLEIEKHDFKGIKDVLFNDTSLKSQALPWVFYTESETSNSGVRFESFTIDRILQNENEATLMLRSKGQWMPRVQSADAMGEARIKSRLLTSPEAHFKWKFKAISEQIYENTWTGLSMRIEYRCPGWPIHWLMEEATWGIGGEAAGNTLIQQDVSAMQQEQNVLAKSEFSTGEVFFLDGGAVTIPLDMMPRGAGACICDFLGKKATALCLFSENPGLTRARLEKRRSENIIHYLDRYYFPLAEKTQSPERKLLVFQSKSKLKRHEIRNLWLDCFTEVRRRIHSRYGFHLELPQPQCGGLLWDEDLKKFNDKWMDALQRDFPEYARLGYKQAFIHGVWESITSDPNPPAPGNICCPYAFRFAELFGGASKMKMLNDAAQANNLQLYQWFSFHLSRYAPVWKKHPDWVLKEANGSPWDGDYDVLWSGRMRSAYKEELKRQILEVLRDTGISGIFWDSYHNLGVTGLDWSGSDKAPQADNIFKLQTELQKSGFGQRIEVVGIFGVSASAIFGFEKDKFRRRLWQDCVNGDHAFALIDSSPGFFCENENYLGEGKFSPELYFWLAAHRAVPAIRCNPWITDNAKERLPGREKAEEYARVNHLYNQVLPLMNRLRLRENGSHVVWLNQNGDISVIWTFKEVAIDFNIALQDLETNEVINNGHLNSRKVYILAQ